MPRAQNSSDSHDPARWASLPDAATAARAILPRDKAEFLSAAAGTRHTMRGNRRALDELRILPRVLTGATRPELATQLARTSSTLPVAVAPMAYQTLAHERGEIAAAEAAKAAGVPYVIPTLSGHSIEDITATGATCWFQLYPLKDKDLQAELVERAQRAGCAALVVTVDAPTMRRKLSGPAGRVTLPPAAITANLPGAFATEGSLGEQTEQLLDPTFDWSDLATLCQSTTVPVIVKGIMHLDDAHEAVSAGASGVVVSNHGGRLLDGLLATAAALPEVREAVGENGTVLMDGGIRSGVDVLKALSLGADGVLVGRPVLWGLAAGTPGVVSVLDLLRDELTTALTLAGCPSLTDARTVETQHFPALSA